MPSSRAEPPREGPLLPLTGPTRGRTTFDRPRALTLRRHLDSWACIVAHVSVVRHAIIARTASSGRATASLHFDPLTSRPQGAPPAALGSPVACWISSKLKGGGLQELVAEIGGRFGHCLRKLSQGAATNGDKEPLVFVPVNSEVFGSRVSSHTPCKASSWLSAIGRGVPRLVRQLQGLLAWMSSLLLHRGA